MGVEQLEHMDTGRGTSHTGSCQGEWGLGEGLQGVRDWGGITLGEIPNGDDGGMDAANHHGMYISM